MFCSQWDTKLVSMLVSAESTNPTSADGNVVSDNGFTDFEEETYTLPRVKLQTQSCGRCSQELQATLELLWSGGDHCKIVTVSSVIGVDIMQ